MQTIDSRFKNNNVINGLDLTTPIYKFLPLKYIPILLHGQLYVGKVASWEDVYENFLFKQNFALTDGTRVTAENLIKCNFGQCWTKADETDAMWRIYSHIPDRLTYFGNNNDLDNVAVRIKTTARKLYDAVYTNDQCMASTYIGNVEYFSQAALDIWLSRLNLSAGNLSRNMAQSLFMKRTEFIHEQEVRIIISYPSDDARINNPGITFNIDPATFIDEILIDPRLIDTDMARIIKEKLVEAGADSGKIKTSQLYKFIPYPKNIIIG